MTLFSNSHILLNKALHDKMSKIYIYQALLIFAKSLIGIFVPVYLFKIGYSIIEIILYSLGASLIFLISIPLFIKIINRIGFKYSLLLSTPLYLIHVLMLNFLDQSILYFHLSWITFGFYLALFWPTFHSEIAANGSIKHRSSQMGTMQIIATIFGTFAPIIGGFFFEYSSFLYLFSVITILILIGIIPLMLSNDINLKRSDFTYSGYLRILRSKKHKNSKKAFIYEGLEGLLLISIWPILVFILLKHNFFNLGVLLTVIAFINLILILYTKSYLDNNRTYFLEKIIKIKSFSFFLKSIVIFFGLFFLFFVELLSKLSQNIFNMLFSSIFYNNATKKDYMEYIILRELYLHIAKIIFGIGIIIILILFGENLIVLSSIIFSGIFISFGLGFLKEEK